MDSLEDMIRNRKPIEPPQVSALKKYVKNAYDTDIRVKDTPKHYLITVPGATLAHRLRIETASIIESCKLDKKLVIHIGY